MTHTKPTPVNNTVIRIAENGAELTLDYDGARAQHKGDSWWGVAVGFRAMQIAASKLSQTQLWDRADLDVESGHPGPGVRDAIDYVTLCVTRERYNLFGVEPGVSGCSRDMKFEWRVSNGEIMVAINLRPDFVPEPFYALLDRLGTDQERGDDRRLFDEFKDHLEARIWREPLASSFESKRSPA